MNLQSPLARLNLGLAQHHAGQGLAAAETFREVHRQSAGEARPSSGASLSATSRDR